MEFIVWPRDVAYFTDFQALDGGTRANRASLAPGFSLGRRRCSIFGDRVKRMYWPATSTNPPHNASSRSAPSSSPEGPARTVIDNFTLTSPTVYFSYNALRVSNWGSEVGDESKPNYAPGRKGPAVVVVKYPELPELGLIASTMGPDGIQSLWSHGQVDSTDFLLRMP